MSVKLHGKTSVMDGWKQRETENHCIPAGASSPKQLCFIPSYVLSLSFHEAAVAFGLWAQHQHLCSSLAAFQPLTPLVHSRCGVMGSAGWMEGSTAGSFSHI